jgi:formylglycine-generating enzyme required for sulfatase activity
MIHVFVSYSHRDDTWVKEGPYGLIPWLAQQLKKNDVEIWYDHALKQLPGAEYRKLIKSHIDRAHLAILLVSQDFVSSDFIQKSELPWIRERVDRGDLSLVPILVGPTLDEDLGWLADRQMMPGKPAPLVEYTESISKWQAVRLEILGAIRDRAREIALALPAEPATSPAPVAPPAPPPPQAPQPAPQPVPAAKAVADAPAAMPAEPVRVAEKAFPEVRAQQPVAMPWQEEAEVRTGKASEWLARAGGMVRKKKTLAAVVGLGLLGLVGLIALVVASRNRQPDSQETVVPVSAESKVEAGKEVQVEAPLPTVFIGADGKWKIPPDGPPPAIAPFDAQQARKQQEAWAKYLGVPVAITNSAGMTLVLIPPGEFDMGSADSDKDAHADEKPRHHVRITRPFYLGTTDVTQEQWEAVMGSNPSQVKGAKNPVEMVSWDHCQVFLSKLNAKTAGQGGKFALPTEAQWEYACRAGSATRYCFGDDETQLGDYAWYLANSGDTTHPVGEKMPNAWGLYDMHGNVCELCQDWYDGGYYVISPADDPPGPSAGTHRADRGGSKHAPAADCRSADRDSIALGERFINVGVRISLVLPDTAAERAKLVAAKIAAPPAAASPESPPAASPPAAASLVGPDGKWKIPPGGPSPAIAPFDEAQAKQHQEAWAKHLGVPVAITNSVGMTLVLIPPGEFDMGSPDSDKDARTDEKPQHHVRITRPFYLGMTEVTQQQWEAVMGSNPSQFKGPKNPAEMVSWDNCQVFLTKLNAKTGGQGGKFVLPTEAQWEFACRAGSTTRYCFGDDETQLGDYAWNKANSGETTHPVGEKKPNAWGLYDVHGNTCGWCQDWYDGGYYVTSPTDDPAGPSAGSNRVDRGGSWTAAADAGRSAHRYADTPGERFTSVGLRVCMVLPDTAAERAKLVAAKIAAPPAVASPESPAAARPPKAESLVGPDGKWKIPPGGPFPAIAPFDAQQARKHQEAWARRLGVPLAITNSAGMTLALIPPGEFDMGSPDSDKDARTDEKPRHHVRITRPFYLGMTDVTQEQWEAVMGSNPSQVKGAKNPVEMVSWDNCQVFLTRLNAKTAGQGGKFVLPTEAQWEYACRAGSITRYAFGDDESQLDEYAWYKGNSGDATHPVGEKKPNAWGLYDLHGNACAWCQDWYDGGYYVTSPADDPPGPSTGTNRVDRGGSWESPADACRSAHRYSDTPGDRFASVGLRVCMVLPDTAAERAKLVPARIAALPSVASPESPPAASPPAAGSLVGPDGKWRIPPGGPPPAIAPFDAAQAKQHQEAWATHLGVPVTIVNSTGMKLALIPPGEFEMGSAASDKDGRGDERPQHRVRITRPFYLGVTHVTQEQWEAVMGSNPSKFPGPKNPVESIAWDHCQVFLTKLNATAGGQGGKFVLPTEAQWEYACRAGSTTKYCFGDDETQLGDYAWNKANSGETTHPVGEKKPNAWGLYDVHGNTCGWCQDWYDGGYYVTSPTDDPAGPPAGTYRVDRGGSWIAPAGDGRSAHRYSDTPGNRFSTVGLRVCMVLPETAAERAKLIPASDAAPPAAASPAPPATARPRVPGSLVGGDGKWKLPPGAPPPAIAPFDAAQAKQHQEAWAKHLGVPVETTNSLGMKLALIPPGEFEMGSPDSDAKAIASEKPQHRVRITRPFYLGMTAVTQQQWQAVMDSNPSQFKGATDPVEMVSWDHCQVFLDKLNAKTGWQAGTYVLPSEAQREYACRAGSTTKFCFGDDETQLGEYAWYKANSGITSHPVGEKKPNAWGLYDMHGEACEWCQDWYDGGYYVISPADDPMGPAGGAQRAIRGGSWGLPEADCRSAARRRGEPAYRGGGTGFRVAVVLPVK